jgi:4-aminobutyrate aminotransferase
MDKALPGSIGGTYGGNAVACAAAIEVLNVYKDGALRLSERERAAARDSRLAGAEKIIDNVKARSKEFFAGLNKLKAKYPIADVRGLGLMIGVEFADSVAPGTASKVSKACGSNGMLVMTAGVFETLRLIPPLIINAGEVETAVGILDRSLAQVFGK